MSTQSTVTAHELPPPERVLPQRIALRNLSLELPVRPPTYLVASIIISIGGMLFGYGLLCHKTSVDSWNGELLTALRLDTGCIGPVTSMPEFVKYFGEYSSTMHGLIVSSILITASVSSLFSGHLSDKIGRPYAVVIGSTVFSLGAALEAGAVNLSMFICARSVKGVGEGVFLSTLTV